MLFFKRKITGYSTFGKMINILQDTVRMLLSCKVCKGIFQTRSRMENMIAEYADIW